MSNQRIFHSLQFTDVDAGMAFLTAVGFTERLVVLNTEDPKVVEHAQFAWGEHGGVMCSSAGRRGPESPFSDTAGTAQCYCVVSEASEVDRIHEAALAIGAQSVRSPEDEDHGGRGCTVRDREGNQWSFGTYAGE